MSETAISGSQTPIDLAAQPAGRAKFIIGGLILLGGMVCLIVSNIIAQQQYFMTVDELLARQSELAGRKVRVSGAVLGDSIEHDGLTLSFAIVHIPDSMAEIEEMGGLDKVLSQAVNDPEASRIQVVLYNEPRPDLLQHEAQAVVTGILGQDGVFYADELLLKCPTRYEEDVPDQVGD